MAGRGGDCVETLGEYVRAFLFGGLLCAIGQILIDKTGLTPARILTAYVVAGVVLGGLGNICGSIVATVVIYVLPEALREYADLRMLLYAIILIVVMLVTNNPTIWNFFARVHQQLRERKGGQVE